MARHTITKSKAVAKAANMADYEARYDSFDWADARRLIDGLPGGHLNIAHEAIERHVAAGHGAQVALRWIANPVSGPLIPTSIFRPLRNVRSGARLSSRNMSTLPIRLNRP
ncbi:hypothetical protein [Roseovarius lutimaris]|uniref:hypothetical protein n=1 Tax=Roseovarius lutimaris TaxID=1005928 RepID=UPI001160B943|nr:hypothetical protein [Roseovarius lutimaris]